MLKGSVPGVKKRVMTLRKTLYPQTSRERQRLRRRHSQRGEPRVHREFEGAGGTEPIAVGVTVGSLTAMVSAVLIVRLMGGDAALAATFAPKSATTPIAMAVADAGGGIVSLAAVLPVLTGVLGAVFAPWVLDRLRVRDPRVRGLANPKRMLGTAGVVMLSAPEEITGGLFIAEGIETEAEFLRVMLGGG